MPTQPTANDNIRTQVSDDGVLSNSSGSVQHASLGLIRTLVEVRLKHAAHHSAAVGFLTGTVHAMRESGNIPHPLVCGEPGP
jgi:hypothetical protein